MKSSNFRQAIPLQYKKFFWDVDFNKLDLEKHRKFIMERFLNYGTFDTFKWIFKTFNSKEVEEFIEKKGKYTLSKNSFYFWNKIAREKNLWKKN